MRGRRARRAALDAQKSAPCPLYPNNGSWAALRASSGLLVERLFEEPFPPERVAASQKEGDPGHEGRWGVYNLRGCDC
jgi:hypothetical protein